MYRTGDGEYHCPRCDQRDDICPACDGYGYRLRGRVMSTCTICEGTGSRIKYSAPMSGSLRDRQTEDCSSAAFVAEEVSLFPDVACRSIGPLLGWHTTKCRG